MEGGTSSSVARFTNGAHTAAAPTAKPGHWKRERQQAASGLQGDPHEQHVGGSHARRRRRRDTHKVTATVAQKVGKKDPERHVSEPYIVIITNVENDFARLHQIGLRSYCRLDPNAQRDVCATGATTAELAGRRQSENSRCRFSLRCRTETRSAELCVYGTTAASVATIFAPHGQSASPRRRRTAEAMTGQNTVAKNVSADVVVNNGVASDAAAMPAPIQPVGVPSETPFTSLQHMVSMLRHKPYLGYPPKMYLHELPVTHVAGTQMHGKQMVSAQVDPDSTAGNTVVLEHSDGCQSRLATVLAVTSAKMTLKQMRHQLSDLSGFVCCWSLRPRHFRLVFRDSTDLFAAKRLLDQFELSNHTQVSLRLSDTLTRAYDAFVSAQERAESADFGV